MGPQPQRLPEQTSIRNSLSFSLENIAGVTKEVRLATLTKWTKRQYFPLSSSCVQFYKNHISWRAEIFQHNIDCWYIENHCLPIKKECYSR